MRQRTIAIPRLLHVGSDCLDGLPALLGENFDLTQICVGCGGGPSRGFAARVVAGLRDSGLEVVEQAPLEGRLEQAADTAAVIINETVSLTIGVGGGRVIDTMKLAAARTNTDFISVPTTIAHDGISSPVASLEKDGIRRSYAAAMPSGIIVDVSVIASAPPRTLRAGVGDLLSNLTAILDWQLADRLGFEKYDAFSAMIAESAARPILKVEDLTRPESHELLAKGLLLSGLAMAAAGTSRPCSGAEHLLSHSLDGLLGPRAAMHGEQVAIGSLISAFAHASPLFQPLRSLFSNLGLPTHPSELGISPPEMTEAIRNAPATRPERFTIFSQLERGDAELAELVERAFGPLAGVTRSA